MVRLSKAYRFKRLFQILLVALVLTLTYLLVPWQIILVWIEPLPDSVQEQANEAVDHGFDGIIVYVDQTGKPPALYAAGWKNKQARVPADPDALFKIASISKLYLAVATAKLVNEKRLSLDDALAKLLPHLVSRIAYADQITLRMLLQHRSGIPDWIDDKAFPWGDPPKELEKILDLVLDDPADFAPDSRYDYSNTNYLLIGQILDKTLGYPHQQFIKKEILDTLGLTHTFGYFSDVDSSEVVSGYDTHYKGDVKGLDFISPSGSMVATAEDVGIFLRALNDGSLLDDDEQAIYSSIYSYEHTGLLPGYQSIARYHPDIDAVVIQFVNTSGGYMWSISEIIYNRIIKILKKESSGKE